jgi:HSP20 family protein
MANLIPWRKKQKQITKPGNLPEKWWDPFGADDFFPSWPLFDTGSWMPKVDVSEGKKHVTVKAEIPGMDKNDIDVSLEDGFLRIQGEKKHESEESDENIYRRESSWGRFSRIIELPAEVEESDVEAKYKNGVLTIKLKKTKESQKRRIQIKT